MNALDNRSYFDLNLTVTEGGYFKPKADVDWSMAMHSSAMCKFYYITKGTCEITDFALAIAPTASLVGI